MSVRELIRQMQVEIRDANDLQPDRAVELLMKLTALLGNIADEIRAADLAYSLILLQQLETSEHANRARIWAETSGEYQRKREARDTKELCVELIRSLKYFLKVKEDELRMSR
jgi:hypothetical protein